MRQLMDQDRDEKDQSRQTRQTVAEKCRFDMSETKRQRCNREYESKQKENQKERDMDINRDALYRCNFITHTSKIIFK